MRLEIAAQSDIGRRKKKNEDFYGVFRDDMPGLTFFEEGALVCIADGLGGHVGGEIASKLAVTTLRDHLKTTARPDPEGDDNGLAPLRVMEQWMREANANVFRTNQDLVSEGKPMGTTLLAGLITPKRFYVCNVGDSRCYHIRDGEIIARTEDHSWVDEQVKLGMMSKAEAEMDSRKNIVTRSVGTHSEVEVDSYLWHIVPGDMLFLCTDGLINMVKEPEFIEEFRRHATCAEIVHNLINLANENGGKDNITVVVANISPSLPGTVYRRTRHWYRKSHIKIWWFILTALIAAASFFAGWFLRGTNLFGL